MPKARSIEVTFDKRYVEAIHNMTVVFEKVVLWGKENPEQWEKVKPLLEGLVSSFKAMNPIRPKRKTRWQRFLFMTRTRLWFSFRWARRLRLREIFKAIGE